MAFRFTDAAAQEVSDVLHAAASANVLEIHHRGWPVWLGGEAHVGDFGIAVNQRLKFALVQSVVQFDRRIFEFTLGHHIEFIGASRQVPVGTDGPKVFPLIGLFGRVQKACVEIREPSKALVDPGRIETVVSDRISRLIKVFENHDLPRR